MPKGQYERKPTPGADAAAAAVAAVTPDPLPQEPIGNAFAPPEVAQVLAEALKSAEVPRSTNPQVNSEVAPSAPPRNLFSGQIKALEVFGLNGTTENPLPGWYLYWFTDEGGSTSRIHQALASGYQFVERNEIAMQDNLFEGNNDLGTHVRKVVNPHREPVEYGYLMKKPLWLHEQHQAEMQAVNDRQEAAIRSGSYNAKPGEGRYVAGQMPGSQLPKIEISSNLKVPR